MRAGLLLLIFIGGCSAADSPGARFDDYLDRLARTLDREIPVQPAPTRTGYPPRRALLQPIDTPRTGWIGFFQLNRCGLMNLVSERNSILGRVAPPQALLAYESQVLEGLVDCRAEQAEDADDAEFLARLVTLIARKQANRAPTIWNETWASEAMAHLFSVAGGDAGLQPSLAGRGSRQALARLAERIAAFNTGETIARDELATIYETLDATEYGGALQIAALEAAAALEQATALLNARLADRPLCFNQRPNRRARVLRTILLDIYGQGVQPYLADLVRAGRLWRDATGRLIEVQSTLLPTAFETYRRETLSSDHGVWERLSKAIETHTERWQDALGQCDLMPGTPAPAD
ncbi:hypothetical protein SADO_09382 [Salinisphaera dokdonensis CL-ES53]|uniref:DUF3080 domain-containing protein n=2 Tax=Salinisphaera TaxID=180541 RepID=A0ABV2B0N0_9GAMM